MAQGLQYARQLPCCPLAHVPSSKSDHQWNADPQLGISGRVPVAAAILLASDGCREAGQAETQTRKRQLEASAFVIQSTSGPWCSSSGCSHADAARLSATSTTGRSMIFHRKRVWTQSSKSQKRVVAGLSSVRKHLRFNSRATSVTRGCLLCSAAEPLERPAAPAQYPNTPAAPLMSEQRLSGITRFTYHSCSPAHCATTAGGGAERCI